MLEEELIYINYFMNRCITNKVIMPQFDRGVLLQYWGEHNASVLQYHQVSIWLPDFSFLCLHISLCVSLFFSQFVPLSPSFCVSLCVCVCVAGGGGGSGVFVGAPAEKPTYDELLCDTLERVRERRGKSEQER